MTWEAPGRYLDGRMLKMHLELPKICPGGTLIAKGHLIDWTGGPGSHLGYTGRYLVYTWILRVRHKSSLEKC